MARVPGLTLRVPAPPFRRDIVLADVTVVEPGRGREQGQTIAARAGRIARGGGIDAGAAIDEYRGHFALPGLIDMHTHLPPQNVLGLVPYFQLLTLAHGVTSTRDAGDADGSALPAARAVLDTGELPAPRLFACGPFVGGEPTRWENTLVVSTPAEARQAVEQLARQGVACIKSYDGLDRATVHALVDAASELGLAVMGHVPTELSFEDARIPDVQHFFGVPPPASLGADTILERNAAWEAVDEARLEETVELSRELGITHTPTLVVTDGILRYRDYAAARRDPQLDLVPRLYPDAVWSPVGGNPLFAGVEDRYLDRLAAAFEKKQELVGRLHEAGVSLRLGTDTQQPFSLPGAALHREMRLFEGCGIAAEEIWRLATTASGEALGSAGLGTLGDGAPADLLVFKRDPTADLGALDSLQAVVSAGRLYRVDDLRSAIASCQRHFRRKAFDRVSVGAARRAMSKPLGRP